MKWFLSENFSESNICPISLCNNKQQALVSSEMSEEAEMRLYNHQLSLCSSKNILQQLIFFFLQKVPSLRKEAEMRLYNHLSLSLCSSKNISQQLNIFFEKSSLTQKRSRYETLQPPLCSSEDIFA